MAQQNLKNLKVGAMVITGIILLAVAFYIIGSKENLFSRTFRLSTEFKDVNGLIPGNQVRFAGINIGTVHDISIVSDSSVKVFMDIKLSAREHIKKNTLASIGTDGLIGNKVINLKPSSKSSTIVENGDHLSSTPLFETDKTLRTLTVTNEEIAIIAKNLREISEKLNNSSVVWKTLGDEAISQELKQTLSNFNTLSGQAAVLAHDLSKITHGIVAGEGNLGSFMQDSSLAQASQHLSQMLATVNAGKGTLGALIYDENLEEDLRKSIRQIQQTSGVLAASSNDLKEMITHLNQSSRQVNELLSDPQLKSNVHQSLENIQLSSERLAEDLKALQHNFLLRKYFKKKERKKRKAEKGE